VPLISGAIAAAVPGFVLGAINAWGGVNVGLNSVFGPSGVLATVMMTSSKGMVWGIVIWLLMIILGYISGFFSTLIGYHIFKNSKKIQWKLE
jgi:N-acetylmuramic acid-specific PTS system IIC component